MKLTAAKNPIEGLRTPQEAEKWLSSLRENLGKITKPVLKLLETLASSGLVKAADEGGGESFDVGKRGAGRIREKYTPTDPKVLSALADQYAKLDELLAQQDHLSAFLVRAPALFRGQKAADKLVANAQQLRASTAAAIGKVRMLLSKLSEGSQPAVFKKLSTQLAKQLPTILKYGSLSRSTMLAIDLKGQPVFYTYLELTNVEGEQAYAHYYIVLSFAPLTNNMSLTTLRAFELPGRFPRGIAIESIKQPTETLRALHKALMADGVANELRRGVPEGADKGLRELHDSILKSKVEDNYIWIKVKSYAALPVKDLHAVLSSKYPNSMFNITQVDFQKGVGYRIALLPKAGGIDRSKLEDLKEALELSDSDMDALKQLLMKR